MRPSRLRIGLSLLAVIAPALALLSAVASQPIGAVTLPSNCTAGGAVVRCTFAYNGTNGSDGTPQAFVVPPGVRAVTVEAWGAEGQGVDGGLGGHARGRLAVAPGAVLAVRVGGTPTGSAGGFNGGGGAPTGEGLLNPLHAGGGASDVRVGGDGFANRVVVAGGGGGEGELLLGPTELFPFHGGGGGGPAGGPGSCVATLPDGSSRTFSGCGAGGTASAGGAGGPPSCVGLPAVTTAPGGTGTPGQGGDGAIATCGIVFPHGRNVVTATGSGGGGGFLGGGGGGAVADATVPQVLAESGGGGSGFVRADATDVVDEAAVHAGNGLVVVSYSRTPPNLRACLHGGWRTFVDDHGRPFHNVVQCLLFVLFHHH